MNSEVNSIIKHLCEKKLSLALAESVTCGLAAHKLATSPGTSEVLKGSVVCYTPEVKRDLLKISERLMKKYTCESAQVTKAMAENLGNVIKADIYAALTGLASPGGSETTAKPVGTVFLCIKYGKKTISKKRLFRGTPLQIRTKACLALYDLICKTV